MYNAKAFGISLIPMAQQFFSNPISMELEYIEYYSFFEELDAIEMRVNTMGSFGEL